MFANKESLAVYLSLSDKMKSYLHSYVAASIYRLKAVKCHHRDGQYPDIFGINHTFPYHELAKGIGGLPTLHLASLPILDNLLADDEIDIMAKEDAVNPMIIPKEKVIEGTKQERADAFRSNWVERHFPLLTAPQKERLVSLIQMCRHVGRPFSHDDNSLFISSDPNLDGCVGWVNRAHIDERGVVINSMTFVTMKNGKFSRRRIEDDKYVCTKRVGKNTTYKRLESEPRIIEEFNGDERQVVVDLNGSITDISPSDTLYPYTKLYTGSTILIIDGEGMEKWLGFSLGRKKKSLMTLLYRTVQDKKRNGVINCIVRQYLTDEFKGIAHRIPQKNFSLSDASTIQTGKESTMRYRHQAAEAFPLFSKLILTSKEVRSTIDCGENLLESLADVTKLKKAVIRKIGRYYWQRTGFGIPRLISELDKNVIAALNACPIERLPYTKKQWNGFLSLLKECYYLCGNGFDYDLMAHNDIALLSRNWEVFFPQWTRILDFLNDVFLHVEASLRMSTAVKKKPSVEASPLNIKLNKTIRSLLMRVSYRELLEKTNLWHDRLEDTKRKVMEVSLNRKTEVSFVRWSPLDEDLIIDNVGEIKWLTHKTDLEKEGREMSHCVGGYSSSCLLEGSHIASIKGRDGGRSTIEFKLSVTEDEKDYKLLIRQHYSFSDGPPPQDCMDVVNWFLENRMTEIDFKKLDEERITMQAYRHVINGSKISFDIQSDEQCQAVLDIYAQFLPKSMRLPREELAALVSREQPISCFKTDNMNAMSA